MTDLRQRIPVVRRAREYHLYSVSGKRYLDLWQNGGQTLLGHRPGRLTTVLKDTISRGLIADLPSVFGGRLIRTLQTMFPAYREFRLSGSPAEALRLACLYLGRSVAADDVIDPLLRPEPAENAAVSLWRPLLSSPPAAEVLFPVLPFAMAAAPLVVCFRGSLPGDFPEQAPISGVLLAGLLRSLHELQHFTMPQWVRPDLLAGCAGWRQQQLYVIPEFDLAEYERVFEAFLDGQVLLSPEAPYLSILPGGEISKGELGKMIGLFRAFPGK
jgi:hypothetical protein